MTLLPPLAFSCRQVSVCYIMDTSAATSAKITLIAVNANI